MAKNASIKAAKKKLAQASESPPRIRKGRAFLKPPIAESDALEPASPSPTKKATRMSSSASPSAKEPSPSGPNQAGGRRDAPARARLSGSSPAKSAATKAKAKASSESREEGGAEHSAKKEKKKKRTPARRTKAMREVKERLENKGASDGACRCHHHHRNHRGCSWKDCNSDDALGSCKIR